MTPPHHAPLSRPLILLMAIATGLAVASNYYAQPLLETIAKAFNLSINEAGFIVTIAQLGYAVGLLFIVPLGDMFERRGMIVVMTLLAAAGLLLTANASSITVMLIGTALTGLFSVVAQMLVPLAATLAEPAQRGRVIGTVMSGLLLGILLARTASGFLAELGGWRAIFWVASVLMVVMALVLWRALPRYKHASGLNYPQLLGSVFSLFAQSRILQTRALIGALTFANFSVLWTSMAFLLAAPPFNYSEGEIGLFGLVGAAGALAATRAGHWADKGRSRRTTRVGLLFLLLSWGAIWFGQFSLISLIAGVLWLDLAAQAVHVTNQSMLYRNLPEARNRITSGYMTTCFVGGAAGSLASAWAYETAHWTGVAFIGAGLSIAGLLVLWLGKLEGHAE